jgi:hypothetical protein
VYDSAAGKAAPRQTGFVGSLRTLTDMVTFAKAGRIEARTRLPLSAIYPFRMDVIDPADGSARRA